MNIGKNVADIAAGVVESTVKKAAQAVTDTISEKADSKQIEHAASDISGIYNKAIAQLSSNTTPASKAVDELTELEKLFAKLETKGKKVIQIGKENDEIDVILYRGKHNDYFKSPDGKIFRVRYSKDDDLNSVIVGAAEQYRKRGFKTPDMMYVNINGKRGVASQLLTELQDPSTNPKALYDIFGTDVLMAQRNAYAKGVTMLDAGGNPVKVSTSGSGGYRVRGERRSDFTEEVTELRSFLDPAINPESAAIFKDMTREDLLKSINRALSEYIGSTDMPYDTCHKILAGRHSNLERFYKRAYMMPQEEGETILQYVTRVQNKIKEISAENNLYTEKLRQYADSFNISEYESIYYDHNGDYTSMPAKEAIKEVIENISQYDGIPKALYMRGFSQDEWLKLVEYSKNNPRYSSSSTKTIRLGWSPEIASQVIYAPNRASQISVEDMASFYSHESSFRPCKHSIFSGCVEDNQLVERGLLDKFRRGEIDFNDMCRQGTIDTKSYEKLAARNLAGAIEGRVKPLDDASRVAIAQLSDEDYAKIVERGLLKDIPNRTAPLPPDDYRELAKISDEDWTRVQKYDLLSDVTPDGKEKIPLKADYVKYVLKLSDEQIETAYRRNLFDRNYQKVMNNGSEISDLAKLSDTEFNNLVQRGLFTNPKYEDLFNLIDFIKTSSLTKHDEDMLKLYGVSFERGLHDWKPEQIELLARIPDKSRIPQIERLNFDDPSGRTSFGKPVKYLEKQDILDIVRLSDKAYKRALQILNDKELIKSNFREAKDITNAVICKDEIWEIMQRRGFLNANTRYADPKTLFHDYHDSGMQMLARIPDDKWEKLLKHNIVSTNPQRGQLYASDVYSISRLSDEEFDKLIKTGIFDTDFTPIYDNSILRNSFNSLHSYHTLEKLCKNLSAEEIEKLANNKFFGQMFTEKGTFMGSYGYLTPENAKLAASLTDEQVKVFRHLADLEKGSDYWLNLHIAKNFNAKELENIDSRGLMFHSYKFEGVDSNEARLDIITQLARLNDTEWKYANKLIWDDWGRFSGFQNYIITPSKSIARLTDFINGRKSIHEFSLREKRELLNRLIKTGGTECSSELKTITPEGTLLPKTYYKRKLLINKLTESIGLNSKVLTEAQRAEFSELLGMISSKDSGIMSTNFDRMSVHSGHPAPSPKLLYSRKKFTNHIYEQVKDLPVDEQRKIYEYYSFEIEQTADGLRLTGYPFASKNKVSNEDIESPKTREIIEKIRPYVDKFMSGNKIFVEGNPKLEAELNKILEIFPEFGTTIGKLQHNTQDFTVDVHTLKVLQEVMSDPRYAELSPADKQVLQLSTILHDITKTEKTIDKLHPRESAFDAYYLVDRLNLPREEKLKIYEVIKNHDWCERVNKGLVSPEEIAFAHRQNDCFKMSSILTKADLKGVKADDVFFKKYGQAYEENAAKIQAQINKIKETSISIPQTKIPKASQLVEDGEIVKTVKKDGITNKVIYLKPGQDLSKIGFADGVTSDSLNCIVHALDAEEQAAVFRALGFVDSDALLSSSWINYAKGNYRVFRGQGFVLKVDCDDIHAGDYKDFGSGFKKDYDTLLKDYIFGQERADKRTFWSEQVKNKFGFSTEEYMKFNDKIKNKSFEQIKAEDPQAAAKLQEIVDEMDVLRRKGGRNYNEWLISRPEIQAGFYWGKAANGNEKTIDDVPLFIREYLEENDLPLIFFGA